MSERIAIVGVGAMGSAMVRGMLAQNAFDAASLSVHDIDPARVEALVAEHGVVAHADLLDSVRDARVVVLAVKPQSFESLAIGLRDALDEQTLVLSIMAGVRLATLQDQLHTDAWCGRCPTPPRRWVEARRCGLRVQAWKTPTGPSPSAFSVRSACSARWQPK